MELTQQQIKKYTGKSVPGLLKLAEKHFNAYIRRRDSTDCYFICISCQVPKDTRMMHAGHYLSAGHNAKTRFDENNVHGQCSACNTHLHGNQARYREQLVKKIGEDEVLLIEGISRMQHKWERFGLIAIIETYKAKCK
jgi:hypothetical protein